MNKGARPASGLEVTLLEKISASLPSIAGGSIGVAVSGGGDSMAALHLVALHARNTGQTVHAITIDHGLRPEAAAEARFVAQACAEIGVVHTVLRWTRPDEAGNLQDQARRGRYALIAEWARAHGIGSVVLGHTLDDQAETFLMRLAREAGLDGLSAMRARWESGGVTWYRPLLSCSRAGLRDFLLQSSVEWIDDPSNEDERFERVRMRKALDVLAPLGITPQVLSGVANNLSDSRHALTRYCAEVARDIALWPGGDVVFDRAGLLSQAPDVIRRLLIGAVRWVNSAGYAPRAHAINELGQAIIDMEDRTLAGCRIMNSDAHVRITREAQAVRGHTAKIGEIWDGRWEITGPVDKGIEVRALTSDGLRDCPEWRGTGHPSASLAASPAVWKGNELIAAPLAGLLNGWSAALIEGRDDFAVWILTH